MVYLLAEYLVWNLPRRSREAGFKSPKMIVAGNRLFKIQLNNSQKCLHYDYVRAKKNPTMYNTLGTVVEKATYFASKKDIHTNNININLWKAPASQPHLTFL